MMKAMALTGDRKSFAATTITKPIPADQEVLVKVKYSAIDTSLDAIASKDMMAGYIHDMKASPVVLGYHFSGTVVGLGPNVSQFQMGDSVFGHIQYTPKTTQGALSEYITSHQDACALKPTSISWELAAASTTEASTSLQALRDMGGLKANQSVLIIGAGGGVGSAAVGVAKSLGASVTAVCSTRDVERVKALGADVVVDRSKENIKSMMLSKFDVVFDAPTCCSLWQARKWLKPKGTFVTTLPTIELMFLGWFFRLFGGINGSTVFDESKRGDLELIAKWLVKGSLQIDIDSTYKIADMNNAWSRQKERAKKGRVVVQVENAW